jgi:hypothetical protein
MWNGEKLLAVMKLEDGAVFRNFVRMSPSDFEMLWQIIGCKTAQTKRQYRTAILPFIQLAFMFRYLASGESFTNLIYTFQISKQSTSAVIPEVCEALIDALRTYVKVSDCNQFYSMCRTLWDPTTVWTLSNHWHTMCFVTYTFSKSHVLSIAKKCADMECWITCNWLEDRLYTDGEEFDEDAPFWWSSAAVTREWEHGECVPEAPQYAVCTICQLK